MPVKQLSLWLGLILLLAPLASASTVRISQIDSSSLLFNQEVKLYLSVTTPSGDAIENLDKDRFSVRESINGKNYINAGGVTRFQVGSNYETGVNFLLLVDNSESMYWTLEGKKTNNDAQRRMTHARKAISAFLKSITNPNDKVGLAVYNSSYQLLAEPEKGTAHVEKALPSITRPTGNAIYSEIYGSLALAVDEFQTLKGRKAIVILSDGVNNPAFRHSKKINPQFGEENVSHKRPLEELQREGISLYVINFGPRQEKKDRNLIRIAGLSGGATFNAHNQKQLQRIYLKIMDQILKEYVISYRATMDPAETKYVKVIFNDRNRKRTASRAYFTTPLFGTTAGSVSILILIAALLAGILLWLVSKLKFEKQHAKPTIEVMQPGAGSPSTQILTLGNEETVIGCAPESDMTIAGIPEIEDHHATIIYDEKKDQYQLVGETKIMVNNQVVTTKVLESGDLINLNGMTIVFDEGSEKETK